MKKPQPRFRVGQVVTNKHDGRAFKINSSDQRAFIDADHKMRRVWCYWEKGISQGSWEMDLRPLTAREIGPRKAR